MHKLVQAAQHDPHAILGLHSLSISEKIIRIWRPEAKTIHLEVFGNIVEAQKVHESGMFEYQVPPDTTPNDYRIYHQNSLLAHDPYSFLPTFGDLDQYLFSRGLDYKIYEKLGAHPTVHHGVEGVKFAVWAPNAKSVCLVGDFNYWDGRTNPMRAMGYSGVWELFVPGLHPGCKYKFEIHTENGEKLTKIDPYANAFELRPANACIVVDTKRFQWSDQEWIDRRKYQQLNCMPMNVYEVHLGSWHKNGAEFLNYREIALQLAKYCHEMAFTHIELMPIQEHPLDESWGYQVTGYFAPTSRFGSLEDFQFFVNHLHQNQIGIILDWVPGHFPTDQFSLSRYDGTPLYEHADPRQGYHPHWFTNIFNFGRKEVSNFLISNALFWIEEMHIDGLRVDAVASMLYLDYGRDPHAWIPNAYGGKENLEAIEFIKHLNSIVHKQHPGVLMIAEESTSFLGVTHPIDQGGLGFDLKWNMGWMNDTLRYMSKDMLFRHYHHNDLTFGLLYAFSEKFILVFSHDEVVHGKASLLSKMPGDLWQKFANLRLLLSYCICQPGKKLLFMGGEIGQWNEWNCKNEIEWMLLNFPTHSGVQRMVKEINHFYLDHSALWDRDFNYENFQWVDFSDTQNSVICYLRKGHSETLLCVHNFTPSYHSHYVIQLSGYSQVQELFNSDHEKYGGSGKINGQPTVFKNQDGFPTALQITLAPLSTMIFSVI